MADTIKILWRVLLGLALAAFFVFEGAFLYDLATNPQIVDPTAAGVMLVALAVVLFFLGRWFLRRRKASDQKHG